MRCLRLIVGFTAFAGMGIAPTAWADNIAACEILLMQSIPDEFGGEAQIASYRPAADFLASVYTEDEDPIMEIRGHAIRAVMCQRDDIIPVKRDYPILATGVPFILSQDFDSTDTDSLTIYWKDGAFRHVYKGYPLTDETQKILDDRLESFSKGDHGLAAAEQERLSQAAQDQFK